jgi:hypothetical protein
MKTLCSILTVLIVTGCAVAHDAGVPRSWLTTQASIEDIHEYYYSLCTNLSKEQVLFDGRSHAINLHCKKGEGNPFKHKLEPGSKIYRYRSPEESWAQLAGSAGFALVENGKIVDVIETTAS